MVNAGSAVSPPVDGSSPLSQEVKNKVGTKNNAINYNDIFFMICLFELLLF